MDVKISGYNCYKNIKNEFDKRNNKKIVYNNLIKSTQKSNSRISIFNKNKSNNKKNNKKEKSINLKSKEIIPQINKLVKQIPTKKDIIKEKQEKTFNLNIGNEKIKTKGNNVNKKQNKIKNNSKENKTTINTIKKDNQENKKSIHNNEQNNLSSKKQSSQKGSIYESPIINKNSDDELVTSFEKKTSELKSPETVSEDSFITDEDEINKNKIKDMNDFEKENNNSSIEKNDKEINVEINDDELIDQENEIIYVDKMKKFETENESKERNKEIKKESKNKNKERNEVNNIKVNIKGSIFNDKEKNNLNKGIMQNYLNQSQKSLKEKTLQEFSSQDFLQTANRAFLVMLKSK